MYLAQKVDVYPDTTGTMVTDRMETWRQESAEEASTSPAKGSDNFQEVMPQVGDLTCAAPEKSIYTSLCGPWLCWTGTEFQFGMIKKKFWGWLPSNVNVFNAIELYP